MDKLEVKQGKVQATLKRSRAWRKKHEAEVERAKRDKKSIHSMMKLMKKIDIEDNGHGRWEVPEDPEEELSDSEPNSNEETESEAEESTHDSPRIIAVVGTPDSPKIVAVAGPSTTKEDQAEDKRSTAMADNTPHGSRRTQRRNGGEDS